MHGNGLEEETFLVQDLLKQESATTRLRRHHHTLTMIRKTRGDDGIENKHKRNSIKCLKLSGG